MAREPHADEDRSRHIAYYEGVLRRLAALEDERPKLPDEVYLERRAAILGVLGGPGRDGSERVLKKGDMLMTVSVMFAFTATYDLLADILTGTPVSPHTLVPYAVCGVLFAVGLGRRRGWWLQ